MSNKLTVEDLNNLRHMLGATPPAKASAIAYRNYFYTDKSDPSMLRLEDHGFVFRGGVGLGNPGKAYFHATREGWEAVGLNPRQVARALAPFSMER